MIYDFDGTYNTTQYYSTLLDDADIYDTTQQEPTSSDRAERHVDDRPEPRKTSAKDDRQDSGTNTEDVSYFKNG